MSWLNLLSYFDPLVQINQTFHHFILRLHLLFIDVVFITRHGIVQSNTIFINASSIFSRCHSTFTYVFAIDHCGFVMIRFIKEGKNWARYLYLLVAFYIHYNLRWLNFSMIFEDFIVNKVGFNFLILLFVILTLVMRVVYSPR